MSCRLCPQPSAAGSDRRRRNMHRTRGSRAAGDRSSRWPCVAGTRVWRKASRMTDHLVKRCGSARNHDRKLLGHKNISAQRAPRLTTRSFRRDAGGSFASYARTELERHCWRNRRLWEATHGDERHGRQRQLSAATRRRIGTVHEACRRRRARATNVAAASAGPPARPTPAANPAE